MALLLLVWIGVLVAGPSSHLGTKMGRRTWSLVLVLVLIAILGRWGHSKQQRKQSGTSNMSCCV
jgi:membrane protease YdiL (CAAX protease family)